MASVAELFADKYNIVGEKVIDPDKEPGLFGFTSAAPVRTDEAPAAPTSSEDDPIIQELIKRGVISADDVSGGDSDYPPQPIPSGPKGYPNALDDFLNSISKNIDRSLQEKLKEVQDAVSYLTETSPEVMVKDVADKVADFVQSFIEVQRDDPLSQHIPGKKWAETLLGTVNTFAGLAAIGFNNVAIDDAIADVMGLEEETGFFATIGNFFGFGVSTAIADHLGLTKDDYAGLVSPEAAEELGLLGKTDKSLADVSEELRSTERGRELAGKANEIFGEAVYGITPDISVAEMISIAKEFDSSPPAVMTDFDYTAGAADAVSGVINALAQLKGTLAAKGMLDQGSEKDAETVVDAAVKAVIPVEILENLTPKTPDEEALAKAIGREVAGKPIYDAPPDKTKFDVTDPFIEELYRGEEKMYPTSLGSNLLDKPDITEIYGKPRVPYGSREEVMQDRDFNFFDYDAMEQGWDRPPPIESDPTYNFYTPDIPTSFNYGSRSLILQNGAKTGVIRRDILALLDPDQRGLSAGDVIGEGFDHGAEITERSNQFGHQGYEVGASFDKDGWAIDQGGFFSQKAAAERYVANITPTKGYDFYTDAPATYPNANVVGYGGGYEMTDTPEAEPQSGFAPGPEGYGPEDNYGYAEYSGDDTSDTTTDASGYSDIGDDSYAF